MVPLVDPARVDQPGSRKQALRHWFQFHTFIEEARVGLTIPVSKRPLNLPHEHVRYGSEPTGARKAQPQGADHIIEFTNRRVV